MKNKFKKSAERLHGDSEKLDGSEQSGVIIAHFGAVVEVENEAGQVIRCHLRKNQEPMITGDHVLWRPDNHDTGIVVSYLPRTSLLVRPENSHRNKLIAANVDTIVIVTAPLPNFSEKMLDRYLVAAEIAGINAVILLNKVDLLNPDELIDVTTRLNKYAEIGYPLIYSSLFMKESLVALDQTLKDKTCIFVGMSGVGKSSLIRTLTGNETIMVGDVSASKLGRHTTTSTRLYHLPAGGQLIDSPGVREFALWNIPKEEIIHGFIECKPFLGKCKFRNCQHHSEPGCALLQAVSDNDISRERWESYLHILHSEKK